MSGSAVVWLTPAEAVRKMCFSKDGKCVADGCMGWIVETDKGPEIQPATKGVGWVPPRPAEHAWVPTGRGRCGLLKG